MLTANKLISQGQGLSRVLLDRAPAVRLHTDTPTGHRFETTDSLGRALLVSLPEGSQVFQGDVLVSADGSLIRVETGAAPDAHAPGPDHVHGPGCGHGHSPAAKVEIQPAAQPHVHGPDCGHGHGH
jgi:urease accessory protein UreE